MYRKLILVVVMTLFMPICSVFGGSIIVWGDNSYGQGNVPEGDDFTKISSSDRHNLALRSDGSLIGWGWNGGYQTSAPKTKDFDYISTGYAHNLALRSNGSLAAWGQNGYGECIVPSGYDSIDIAAGEYWSLALKANGSLVAWGDNRYGACNVPAGNDFIAIAAGDCQGLALRADGSLVAWGDNGWGQGNVPAGNDFTAISAGGAHCYALKSDGSIVGWGCPDHNRLVFPTGNDFAAISAGPAYGLALRSDGSLVGWGWNSYGQTDVPSGHFIAVEAGYGHGLALTTTPPIVDFNGDGIVDCADMCIMVDYWHTDEPLCDIGPMPWGDGIVDVEDLIVLAEYLFTYPGAVAYWKLDETEGIIAHDSVGDNDAFLMGDPAWQPDGGMVAGALQLDGIDDYVSTDFVLNPADGEFSLFAWVKGGAPGQVVISQETGTNLLMADPSTGQLLSDMKVLGRGAEPLHSQAVITDSEWHRVGFTWDGSMGILYVDDIEVAGPTKGLFEHSLGGLYIGAGKNLEVGSFWSGLIDDVRIYDRAITP